MNYGDLNEALQLFLRWGSPNMPGLAQLLKPLRDAGAREQRMEGRTPYFNGFMQRVGDMFPPGINSLDELLEHLQRQMAQMQSLLQSMSPEAREELRQMIDALLQDDSLRLELARLSGFMQAMMPPSELSERYPFFGEDPLSMGEAMGLMERLQQMDRLESQLERGRFG